MYYIYENDKPSLWCQIFKKIKMQGNQLILPQGKKTDKQLMKLAEKTVKIMEMASNKKIVLSKELQKQKEYVNYLQTKGLDIVDGKWLYFMLLPEIVQYVLRKKEQKEEETTIHILVNDINDNVISMIKLFSKTYKTLCIVTKHTEKLKKAEEQILEETGTMITVMNNKRKSLAKATIIINVDFPEEFVNQYIIEENATILDIPGNTTIKKKRFNGKVIVDYDIFVEHKQEYKEEEKFFLSKDLYEAEFYKKQPYDCVREKIKKDGIHITFLYTKHMHRCA